MATVIVPTRGDIGAYNFRVILDGDTFDLRVLHNAREDIWYLDIRDSSGVAIKDGLKLVSQMPVTARIVDDRRPQGELLALDTTGLDVDAAFDELGSRVLLVYEEAATVP